MLTFFTIIIAVATLGFIIGFHELGHFAAAKMRGMVAPRFSIGFGPRLLGWKWKGTDFRISLIPLGGYVSLPQLADMGKTEGSDAMEDVKDLPPISYTDKMIVSVAGPVFNLILAVILSIGLWIVGRDVVVSTQVAIVAETLVNAEGKTVPGPAFVAGVQVGDIITAIDGNTVEDWSDVRNAIVMGSERAATGSPVCVVSILREGIPFDLVTMPALILDEGFRALGFAPDNIRVRVHQNPLEQIKSMAEVTATTLLALFEEGSDVKVRNLSGPVGIVHGLSRMAQYGIMDAVWFAALINVNLAMINLIPIPVLDGGHMFFATIRKLTGLNPSARIKVAGHLCFVVCILGFILYVSFFDIERVGKAVGLSKSQPAITSEN